jgi:hypothetical protein
MSNPVAPATPEALVEQVTKLTETVVAQGQALKEMNDRAQAASEELRKSPFGAPFARKGESVLTSRGYSYLKAFGVIAGQIDAENAKVECLMAQKLKDHHSGYSGYNQAQKKSLMVPLGAEFVVNNPDLADEVRATVKAGVTGSTRPRSPTSARWRPPSGLTKALSLARRDGRRGPGGPPDDGRADRGPPEQRGPDGRRGPGPAHAPAGPDHLPAADVGHDGLPRRREPGT